MRRLLAAVVVLAISSVLVPLGGAASAADPNAPTVMFGAYAQPRGTESQRQAVERLEALAGRQLAVTREFLLWDHPFPTTFHTWARDTDHRLIVSVKALRSNGTRIPWANIANAAPGSTLYAETVSWARRMRDFGAPVYFTFHHEPEAAANTSNGTAAEFVAAWQRVVSIFRAEGASNVEFMWIMTDYAFDLPATDRRHAPKWYPGDAWVDGMGIDAYNWFTCRQGINTAWKPLARIIESFRRFGLAHPDKELWLTEWASTEDPNQAGRKGAWIDEARALFKQPGYEQFRGLAYFHRNGAGAAAGCPWWVDSSSSSAAAFAAMGQDVFYTAEDGAPLPPPPPPPPTTGGLALLVAGSTALNAGDASVRSRLEGLGYVVTVADDDLVTPADTTGRDVVLVSNTVSSSALGAELRDVPAPVLLWKPALYDDMAMTASGAWGTTSGAQLAVTDPAHPLAAGRSGTVQIVASPSTLPWGAPQPSAETVGTVNGNASLFAYRGGAALAGGRTAAACRVAVPAYAAAVTGYTADGWALFENAVTWADGDC